MSAERIGGSNDLDPRKVGSEVPSFVGGNLDNQVRFQLYHRTSPEQDWQIGAGDPSLGEFLHQRDFYPGDEVESNSDYTAYYEQGGNQRVQGLPVRKVFNDTKSS